MSVFDDTTGWFKADKWIIERPDKLKTQDRGLRLYGQKNKFNIRLSELRASVGARWFEEFKFERDGKSEEEFKQPGHITTNVIFAKGEIEDNIFIFGLGDRKEARRFNLIKHVRIVPIDTELRIERLAAEDQMMSGVIYFDDTENNLGLEVHIDREAFMSVFDVLSKSPLNSFGSLRVSANVYEDEIEQFHYNIGDIRNYGLLLENDKYSPSAPVGVEDFSVSFFSSPHIIAGDDQGAEEASPATKKGRWF